MYVFKTKSQYILFFILIIIFSFLNPVLAQEQEIIIDSGDDRDQDSFGAKLETGSVNPQYGPPGEFTFQTYFQDSQNREPEYIKIFILNVNEDVSIEEVQPYLMQRSTSEVSSKGVIYTYTTNINEEGQYQFYFEAKVGPEIIHNPYYGGQDCTPGLCSDCCGAWGGPKVISEGFINEHKVYLFDKDKDDPIWNYDVGSNWVTSVSISSDSEKVAVADNQGNLYLFNVNSNRPIWTFTAEFDTDNGNITLDKGLVAFSNNKYLVVSLKGKVFLFQTESSKPIWEYDVGWSLEGLEISDDGRYIAAGGHDTKVYLWEMGDSNPKWEYKVYSEGGILGLEGSVIRSMTMTIDGSYIAAGTSCPDRSVYVFTPESSEPILQVKAGSNFPVETIDISDDGQYVIAAGGGSSDDAYSALLIHLNQKEPVWKFEYSTNPARTARISPDGQLVTIGYILDGVYFLKRDSNDPQRLLKNTKYISDMAFSKNGEFLVIGTGANRVILLPPDGNQILKSWKIDNKVESVAISTDGQYIVAGTGLNIYISDSSPCSDTVDSQNLEPELVNLSGLDEEQKQDELLTERTGISYVIPLIGILCGIGLITFSSLFFIRMRKKWLILIIILGIFLVVFSSYYILRDKGLLNSDPEKPIKFEEEDSGEDNIQIDNSNNNIVIEKE